MCWCPGDRRPLGKGFEPPPHVYPYQMATLLDAMSHKVNVVAKGQNLGSRPGWSQGLQGPQMLLHRDGLPALEQRVFNWNIPTSDIVCGALNGANKTNVR